MRGDLRPSGQYLAAVGFPRLLSTHWGAAKPDASVAGADEASGVADGTGTCPAGAAPAAGTGALIT